MKHIFKTVLALALVTVMHSVAADESEVVYACSVSAHSEELTVKLTIENVPSQMCDEIHDSLSQALGDEFTVDSLSCEPVPGN